MLESLAGGALLELNPLLMLLVMLVSIDVALEHVLDTVSAEPDMLLLLLILLLTQGFGLSSPGSGNGNMLKGASTGFVLGVFSGFFNCADESSLNDHGIRGSGFTSILKLNVARGSCGIIKLV